MLPKDSANQKMKDAAGNPVLRAGMSAALFIGSRFPRRWWGLAGSAPFKGRVATEGELSPARLNGAAAALRLHRNRGADLDGIVELARFPIGHPDAAVRGRLARQVALVQAEAGSEFHEVRHRGADEMGVARPGVAPGIDIRLHD